MKQGVFEDGVLNLSVMAVSKFPLFVLSFRVCT